MQGVVNSFEYVKRSSCPVKENTDLLKEVICLRQQNHELRSTVAQKDARIAALTRQVASFANGSAASEQINRVHGKQKQNAAYEQQETVAFHEHHYTNYTATALARLRDQTEAFLTEIVGTMYRLAEERVGASVALSFTHAVWFDPELKEMAKASTILHKPWKAEELLQTFEDESSPLHGGLVIIDVPGRKIHSAANKIATIPVDYTITPYAKFLKG